MHLVPKRPLFRSLLAMIALPIAAATVLSLPSCQMVDDTLLGVSLSNRNATTVDCIEQCKETRRLARNAENERFKAAIRACGNDPVCKALEEARRESNLARIEQEFTVCKDQCHHQGGGNSN